MPLNLSAGRLRKEHCATSIEYGLRPGESKLGDLDTDGIWDYMVKPIVDAQEAILRAREREDLIPLVPRYNTFVLLLGMVRPMQVDGVWDRDGLVYNAYLARLLTRGQYYDLHKHCRPDVVDLIEAVSAHWAAAWTMGGAATGDETLVPHTGLRAGPLKMYIVRKPHNTGIKLHCLADAGTGYIVDVYLYTGRRGVLRRHGCGAGNLNARQLMAMWSKQLPVYTVLVGDSFFGSHATAQRLAREGRPFITMVRKDTAGVQQGGETIQAGQTAVASVDGHKYALRVYKQPKTGGKPPKLAPILSNVWYAARGPLHHTGREIHPLVAAYRQLARGVDSANQMALQMRLLGRQMSWSQAVRGFLLRYAAANAFATCRALERCRGTDSMWEWQWALLRRRYCTDAQPRRNIHVPVAGAQRRTCAHCGKGRTQYVCSGCPDTPLHVQCFAPAHGITTTGTEDAQGSEPPLSQETQEGDAGEDDPKADGEDEEEADSNEEEEEEEAEDARGSVEDDTLENFSFSVQ